MLLKVKKSSGFTFLETLVVISIFSLIFPLALSILFVILQQQLRIFSLSEVKRQGDYIITYLEDNISNHAYKIYNASGDEICDASLSNPSGDVASFKDRYNSEFSIVYNQPDLAFNYITPPVFPAPTFAFKEGLLNTSKVRIESFNISCERATSFSAPLLNINFTICFNINNSCVSVDPQKVISLNYQTNLKLRSYPAE